MTILNLFHFTPTDPAHSPDTPGEAVTQLDPQLLAQLAEEHMDLLERYGRIQWHLNREETSDVRRLLADFMHALHDHAQLENNKLYAPLRRRCQSEPATQTIVRDCQMRMNSLLQDTVTLFNTAVFSVREAHQVESFRARLSLFGASLAQCIEIEETRIYPLCQSPHRD